VNNNPSIRTYFDIVSLQAPLTRIAVTADTLRDDARAAFDKLHSPVSTTQCRKVFLKGMFFKNTLEEHQEV
jgi:hypothetical protein